MEIQFFTGEIAIFQQVNPHWISRAAQDTMDLTSISMAGMPRDSTRQAWATKGIAFLREWEVLKGISWYSIFTVLE